MVSKGDLFRSIKLSKLNKTQSFELIFEALINNVLLFSVNDIKYDPSDVIMDLIDSIWPQPFNPKKEFKYGVYNGDKEICIEKFKETLYGLSDDNACVIIFFNSDDPKFNSQ